MTGVNANSHFVGLIDYFNTAVELRMNDLPGRDLSACYYEYNVEEEQLFSSIDQKYLTRSLMPSQRPWFSDSHLGDILAIQ